MKHPLACTLPRRRVNAHPRAARATPSSRALCPFPRDVQGSPPLPVSAILCPRTHPVVLIFSFSPPFCFVSSCLMGFLTVVYQVSPARGPWGQTFSLIACLPPACSLGSPLSTFQTTLIITPLGPACSRHLTSLAGRFVSLLHPPSSPLSASVLTRSSPWSPLAPFLSHSSFFPVTPLPK